jgi:hypothetical protein
VAAETFMPEPRSSDEDEEGHMYLRLEQGNDGRWRYTHSLRLGWHRFEKWSKEELEAANVESSEDDARSRQATASLYAEILIARTQQAQKLAATNNLAPIATSVTSHLASLVHEEGDVPVMEGAMLGVVVDAFVARDDTSVEDIVAFREKNMASIQRFRAAMTDLGAALRQADVSPEAALAAARDVYRNRVEPDLGTLEDRLSESRVKFLARSLFGAAALAVSPLTTPIAVESAARLGAQTINYRFSREGLLEEHPYSFLHRLSSADLVLPRQLSSVDLVSPDIDPTAAVYGQFDALLEIVHEVKKDPVLLEALEAHKEN